MAETRRLLVIVDPTSDAQPAVERAVWLAERLGATVELFVCDYDPYLAGERFYDTDSLQRFLDVSQPVPSLVPYPLSDPRIELLERGRHLGCG